MITCKLLWFHVTSCLQLVANFFFKVFRDYICTESSIKNLKFLNFIYMAKKKTYGFQTLSSYIENKLSEWNARETDLRPTQPILS